MDKQEYKPIDELSFRDASIELERIVRSLESGDLELEDSLEKYARGVELLVSLKQRLSEAEQKVNMLYSASTDLDVPDTASAPAQGFMDE